MGDAAAFVGRLKDAERSYVASRRRILTRCAEVGVTVITASPGYPHGMVAKKPFPPPRVRVTDDFAYVKVAPVGRLVNDDTRAHFIVSKKGRGSKANRQRAAAFLSAFGATGGGVSGHGALEFGGGFRAWVKHPGTRGKHFMEKGREAAMPLVARTYQAGVHAELGRIFKGG